MFSTLPNQLTVLRLIATALIPLAYLLPHPVSDGIVLVLFIVASVTDFFDGWIARRYDLATRIGAMMDPIADKALVGVTLLVLCGLYGASPIIVIPAAAILLREFAISGLREALAGRPVDLAVSRLAKWKTAVQMLGIGLLLVALYANFSGLSTHCIYCGRPALGLLDLAGLGLLWLAAILTWVTGWQYLAKGIDALMEAD